MTDFTQYIGQTVTKASGKPFKSLAKQNTVKGVTTNPNTSLAAFTFVEDDSVVDCHQCLDSAGSPIPRY
jgi:hypothetical protein